jgi:hypothetical protein
MENVTSHSMVENPEVMARRLMQRAHNLDGLPEMAAGVTLLVAAALIEAQVIFPGGTIGFKLASVAFGLVIPAMILIAQWAIKWIRRRFLMEHVGFVELKPADRKRVGAIFAIAALVGGAAAYVAAKRIFLPGSWLVLETGIMLGALAALSGRSLRFVVGGVAVALAGILIAAQRVDRDPGMAMLFGFAGLLALVSGVVVFARFMGQKESGE